MWGREEHHWTGRVLESDLFPFLLLLVDKKVLDVSDIWPFVSKMECVGRERRILIRLDPLQYSKETSCIRPTLLEALLLDLQYLLEDLGPVSFCVSSPTRPGCRTTPAFILVVWSKTNLCLVSSSVKRNPPMMDTECAWLYHIVDIKMM